MDSELGEIQAKLWKQNDVLGKARNAYLAKEAERKYFEANLILNAPGKSMAERRIVAESSLAYLEFHQALARLEAIFRFQELKMQVLDKEFQAIYLSYKIDASRNQGG